MDLADVRHNEMASSTKQQKLNRINGDLDIWGVLVIANMSKTDVVKFIRAMIACRR